MRMPAAFTILLFTAFASAPAQAGGKIRGVVELFTSQGCSSCPSADRVLGEFVNRGGVIGLAWHVDYWDYLGWKDTFSAKAFTSRQEAYNNALGAGVYTPQIIVNGSKVATTGNLSGSTAAALGGLPVAVSVKNRGGKLTINAGAGSGSANLYLVTYTDSATVAIGRGENGGRKINYRHAVSGLRNIGKWNGSAASFNIAHAGSNCAILLQRGSNGPIIGAAICG
jgi:hypothetical protein